MELRSLRYFLTVAGEGNITKAAQLLHITQPALSRQLMQLEAELGVTLLDRSGRHIRLTEAGLLLAHRARQILALSDRTRAELIQGEDGLAGQICIGCGELLSMDELAVWMARFRERYPLVTFDVYSGTADSIQRRMEAGTVDLGLLLEPVDTARYAFLRLGTREQWCVVVREDSELAQRESVTPEDVVAQPVLLPARESVRNELTSWLGDCAQRLRAASTFHLFYNGSAMVRQGMGIALCMKLNCRYEGLKCVPLSPNLELGSVLVWKEGQACSRVTTAFIDHVRQCVKSMDEHTK